MSETPREPDRFDKQGDELACAFQTVRCPDRKTLARQIAAALRAAESSALERAAQVADESREDGRCIAFAIRAMKKPDATSAVRPRCNYMTPTGEQCLLPAVPHTHINDAEPAAAPAAEPRLDNLAAESPAPAAETGKEKGAEALTRCIAGQRETLHAAGKRIAELEALVAEANRRLAKLAARAAPPEGEGT